MSLASTLEEMMTPQLVGSLAARSGLPDATTKKGITGATATVLDGLVNKAHDTTTMNRVVDLVATTPDQVDADKLLDDNAPLRKNGNALLGMISPDSSGIASKLARSLGIGGTTASGLLATAASLAIGALGKIGRAAGGFNASTLASTLLGEKQAIHAAVPAGVAPSTAPRERVEHVKRRSPWWPLLLIAALGFGIWLWNRGRGERHEAPAPAPAAHDTTTRQPTFPAGSVEGQFLDQLRAPTADTTKTFSLDKVEFDPNSAMLRPGASRQLAGIAQILEANPRVRVEVGGYADATGTPEQNEKLSQARAESVRQALVADGVGASRITAVGQGAAQAKRTTIRVTSR